MAWFRRVRRKADSLGNVTGILDLSSSETGKISCNAADV